MSAPISVTSPDAGADWTVKVRRRRERWWAVKVAAFIVGLMLACVVYLAFVDPPAQRWPSRF